MTIHIVGPWYDWLAMIIAVCASGWVIWEFGVSHGFDAAVRATPSYTTPPDATAEQAAA